MMTQTHAITGLAAWMAGDAALRAFTDHPYTTTIAGACIAFYAAKAPDIDNPDSRPGRQINRLIPGLSDTIESVFGHRGITHWAVTGLINGAIIGFLASMVNASLWWIGLAVAVGWTAHIAGDCCTYRGAPAFAPFRRGVVRLPYGYRIECGGQDEIEIVYPASLVFALLMSAVSLVLAFT